MIIQVLGISDGKTLVGLTQSSLDLKAALDFVNSNEKLNKYKLFLYGQNLGGYAVTSVLNYETDVDGVVSISGFNNAKDMLVEYGKKLYGNFVSLLSPYVYIYERILFGDSAYLDGIRGINNAPSVPIFLLHSQDDEVISLDNSLIANTNMMLNPSRLKTVLYVDKSDDVVKSYDSIDYSSKLRQEYNELMSQYNNIIPQDVLSSFYSNQDISRLYDLDYDVMNSILDFFNELV